MSISFINLARAADLASEVGLAVLKIPFGGGPRLSIVHGFQEALFLQGEGIMIDVAPMHKPKSEEFSFGPEVNRTYQGRFTPEKWWV